VAVFLCVCQIGTSGREGGGRKGGRGVCVRLCRIGTAGREGGREGGEGRGGEGVFAPRSAALRSSSVGGRVSTPAAFNLRAAFSCSALSTKSTPSAVPLAPPSLPTAVFGHTCRKPSPSLEAAASTLVR
jgi:hypothetical protein